jgi:DNA invertase Pin-like site-specific DNA recombinase
MITHAPLYRNRYLREGDTLIVWRLDRLGRDMRGIVNTLHELTERGVTVRSLHDGVDTSTSTGRMVAGILMAIAEYERELVRERTALKLEHARRSGRKFGRPTKLTADQAALARRMKASGETAATICETLGIGRTNSVPVFGRERRGLICCPQVAARQRAA